MKLLTAHKVLIRAAIGFGVIFTGWSGAMWSKSGSGAYILVGVSSLGATVAMFIYLRNFIRNNSN